MRRGIVFTVLVLAISLSSYAEKINKRVYADYHGGYGTRITDGSWEHWKLSGCAKGSAAKVTSFNHNPDLVDAAGRGEIASVLYPLVGPQSDRDPDYFEYQVLQAKVAHIDGFVIEWGRKDGHMDQRLPAMMEIAAKYDFKIGVDWCHNWLFMHLRKVKVEDRGAQIRAFEESLKHLLTDVYTQETGIFIDSRPLVILFGGGRQLDTTEFAKMLKEKNYLPKSAVEPLFLRGMAVGAFARKDLEKDYSDWMGLVDGNFGWIPGRPRGPKDGPLYLKSHDMYAISGDTVDYQKTILELNELYAEKGMVKIRTSSSTPGMDNRPSFGWGGKLKYIDWENGNTYRKQWQFNVKNRDKIDIVFIDTWNDFPEATVIEPTANFGFREIKSTERYAAAFKGVKSNQKGIELPAELFKLRKASEKLAKIGVSVPDAKCVLDTAAMKISKGEYVDAKKLLDTIRKQIDNLENKVEISTLEFEYSSGCCGKKSDAVFAIDNAESLKLKFKEETAEQLRGRYFEGFIEFDYFDEGSGNFMAYTQTNSADRSGKFSHICAIKKGNSSKWKHAKVRLFSENLQFVNQSPELADIVFANGKQVRDIRFSFDVYRQKAND